jgi:phosphoesterase RecJ-like protein
LIERASDFTLQTLVDATYKGWRLELAEARAQLRAALELADTVFILTHPNPDADAISSAEIMQRVASAMGKDVRVLLAADPPAHLQNLLTSYQIVASAEDLPAHHAEKKRLWLLMDIGAPERLGEIWREIHTQHSRDQVVVIDHHGHVQQTNPEGIFGIDDPRATSTTELLWLLIDPQWGISYEELAPLVYAGLLGDTEFGMRSEVSIGTSLLMALLKEHCNYADILFKLAYYQDFSTSQEEWRLLERLAVQEAGLAHALVSYAEMHLFQRIDKGKIAEELRKFSGVQMAVCAIENEPGKWSVSLRSGASQVDVRSFAIQFGGGGHTDSAGCKFLGTRDKLLKECQNFLSTI